METLLQTPVEMLDHWVATRGDEIYLRQPRDGSYLDFSWRQVRQQARQLAGALRQLGLVPGDRIALLSKNCAEWFIADLALMLGGYVSVPIYPTANADTIRYVLEHSGAKALFAGMLDDPTHADAAAGDGLLRLALPYDTIPVRYGWHELLRFGPPLTDPAAPDPRRTMTIVYTSGSTGDPKGVVHTFASLGWAGHAVTRDLGCTPRDRTVSYLPLAHITERVYIELASLYSGGVVAFVESRESFLADLTRARPTLFLSIPRLWTLFRRDILERIGARRLDLLLRIPLVRGLVQRKIRGGLGLTAARTLGCGSAPVVPSLLEWYWRAGLNITEAWGMTENCAYGTLNHPFRADKIGSAGRPGLDCEVRASDRGELLFRSPGLMTGYHKQPEATAAAFTEDGFFRTGDLCRIDEDGYVFITGRARDPFKTARGKYVVPAPIERELEQHPDIELSCVIGLGLPRPVALVQLSEPARSRPREPLRARLEQRLASLNSELESHARLDAIVVVREPWTVENDALTPTLKVKRYVLDRRFRDRVEGIRGGRVRWEDEL